MMKQLVITLHGIRTFGRWQERLEHLLVSSAPQGRKLTVLNYKYGYFSIFAFIFPPLRAIITRRFSDALQEAVKGQRWDRIDIVAHSFGTHIAAWAIKALPPGDSLQIHTVVLAGSVLKPDFRWSNLLRDRIGRVVNDCGYLDWTLILNQFVLFTGTAGLVGFRGLTSEQLRNRYFRFGHSGFFEKTDGAPTDEFMRAHWLPLLLDAGAIAQFDWRPNTFKTGVLAFVLNNLAPVKFVFYLSIVVAATAIAGSIRSAIRSGRHTAATNANQIAKERLSQRRIPESAAFLAQAVRYQPSQRAWIRDLVVMLSAETWFLPSDYVPASCQQTRLGCRRAVVKQESDDVTQVWLVDGISNERIGALFQTSKKVDSVFLSPSGSRLIIFAGQRVVFFDPLEKRILRTVVNESHQRDFIDPTEGLRIYGTGTIGGSQAVIDADADPWKSDHHLVGMSEDGAFAAFNFGDALYLTRQGCELGESVLTIPDAGYVEHVSLSTASSVLLIATKYSVRFVDIDTSFGLGEPTHFEGATSAVFSPDGLRAMVSSGKAAQLFSAKSGKPLSLRWSTADSIASTGSPRTALHGFSNAHLRGLIKFGKPGRQRPFQRTMP